jgi:hypothetical protein
VISGSLRFVITESLCLSSHHGYWNFCGTSSPRCCPPVYDPARPLGCHRRRIDDRVVFGKAGPGVAVGCSYESIADCTCSATTIRDRRDEWIQAGIFA